MTTLRLGRYETLRAIASGGMAVVHLGRALGAGGFERFVAIKLLHPHLATDPEFVAMFLDEARLAARVRHPNVVATIDVQEDPLFLVMEYIEGPSVFDVMRHMFQAKSRVPLDVTLRIFIDTLAGLHAAHDLVGADGAPLLLVHRDVSPQNLLVGTDGISRITDFGVARAESRLTITRSGQLKGKIAYMAPEQLLSEPVDRRSDLYASGVVLWEMLTGQRLFRGENDGAIVAQILAGVKKSPRDVYPALPEPINKVCMRALQHSPEARYPTAHEFADALEDAAKEADISVGSPRAVAAFIKELAVHKGLDDVPPAPSSGSGLPPSSPGKGAGTAVPPGSTPSKPRIEASTVLPNESKVLPATVRTTPLRPRPRSEDTTLPAPLAKATPNSSAAGSKTAGSKTAGPDAAGSDAIGNVSSSTRVSLVLSTSQRPRPILKSRGMVITMILVAISVGAFFVIASRNNEPSSLDKSTAAHANEATESPAPAPPPAPVDAPPAPTAESSSDAPAPRPSSSAEAPDLPPEPPTQPATSSPTETPDAGGGTPHATANPPATVKRPKPTTPPGFTTAPSPTTFRPPGL